MFTEDFIKSYDEEGDVDYLLVVDIEYPKTLCMLHSDLPFLPEKMKINKCLKLACNLNDKENYSIHIAALKQSLIHGLKLIRVHRKKMIKLDYVILIQIVLLYILKQMIFTRILVLM